ncbi:NADPH:quinone reductase [Modestobacter sp. DSM 44400]|uniref:zinc-binding dehydrogenase n=1 Tax=Modestobacter sp. DSM 44400 TaxID=1550230 RepID=UPI0008946CAE|nr:zinc-binding dehydrogenase [Modestobacter sp. DSM 44400]SDX91084.1 NADPH:quinone reductase [Modestobacter sp. DSM 44400]
MRAAVLDTLGEEPVVRDHPEPGEAAGHTLVSVTAAPIVPLDQLVASGTSYFGRPVTPYVPGTQGVGVVARSDVLPAGTRVFFATSAGIGAGNGSLAQRCLVPDDAVVPLDPGVPDAAAAALGMSAVAAWMALTERGRLQPGERVLVLGAGGAVGQVAVAAAKVLGAGRVVAVCRSAAAQERARRAGADAVVLLAGDVDELTARLRDACGSSADVVVDPVFGVAATAACRVLADRGRLVNLGGAAGDLAEFSSAVLRSRTVDVLGYTNAALRPGQRRQALEAVFRHARTGRLAVAHEQVPLADARAAWRRQAAGQAGVRLVLTP